MKRTVLTYGLICGAVSSAILLAIVHYLYTMEFGKEDLLGYTSMVLTALLVFFGIRSYRENAGVGRFSFGRGVAAGVLITLISSVIYVAVFQLLYFGLMPGLGEKYAACMVERVRTSGATAKEIVEAAEKARSFKQLFDRPAVNATLTFAEAFPVGLVATLASAAILRKKGNVK